MAEGRKQMLAGYGEPFFYVGVRGPGWKEACSLNFSTAI